MNDKIPTTVQEYEEQKSARLRDNPVPEGQKYPRGSRVRIVDDLGRGMTMQNFPCKCGATVLYTHAHAHDSKSTDWYALDVDGHGFYRWYYEWQLIPEGE